jgi:LCP family protein required for cell wall assembly
MEESGVNEPRQPRQQRELPPSARPRPAPAARPGRRPRHSTAARIVAWTSVILTGALVVAAIGVYAGYRHLNGNIHQVNISGLVGAQPPDHHPSAENIVVIGSDSRRHQSARYGNSQELTTDQSDTLMIMHIPANRQYAEVMSIPRDSWVNIPSCRMGNGQMSPPQVFKINEAFALGNLDGNHTDLGVACTIKTIERDTGIHVDHFIVINFAGFKDMVNALGGVPECNRHAINDPLSGLRLTAGHHLLNGTQALGYVRARYTLGNGSDLERIGRQQAFMSALVKRARSELLNPVAIYRFLDAATRSITIDSQLGGIAGIYKLGNSLKNLPPSKVTFFTLPTYPRSLVDPLDLANVMWTQPIDSQIFQAFRDDVPVNKALLKRHRPPRLPARDVRVAVLNGTGQFGLAASVAPLLQQDGFTVTQALDVTSMPTQTVIRYRPGYGRQASRLGAKISGAAFQRVHGHGPGVTLLLGGNYGTTAQVITPGTTPNPQPSASFKPRKASQNICTSA